MSRPLYASGSGRLGVQPHADGRAPGRAHRRGRDPAPPAALQQAQRQEPGRDGRGPGRTTGSSVPGRSPPHPRSRRPRARSVRREALHTSSAVTRPGQVASRSRDAVPRSMLPGRGPAGSGAVARAAGHPPAGGHPPDAGPSRPAGTRAAGGTLRPARPRCRAHATGQPAAGSTSPHAPGRTVHVRVRTGPVDQRVRPVAEVRARTPSPSAASRRDRLRPTPWPDDHLRRARRARASPTRPPPAGPGRSAAPRPPPPAAGASATGGRPGGAGPDQGAHQGAAGVPHRRDARSPRAPPGAGQRRDAQIAQHHPVAVVHQQIQPPLRPRPAPPAPPPPRPVGTPERMRELQRTAPTGTSDSARRPAPAPGAAGPPPAAAPGRHRPPPAAASPGGPVPARIPPAPPGGRFSPAAPAAQHVFRDPHGLAVSPAGDRVDDHQQLVVASRSRHLGSFLG